MTKSSKKLLALLLAVMFAFSAVPFTASAAETTNTVNVTGIPGVNYNLYKIASVSAENGEYVPSFTRTDDTKAVYDEIVAAKDNTTALYQALGIFLPLITTNCAVLGVAILVIQKDFSLLQSVVYAFSTAIGFGLALTVFAGLREQMSLVNIPKGMQGVAVVLVTAGLLSLAFMGFSGVDGGLKVLFGVE